MKDYVSEFREIMKDESFSDSQVLIYADNFISELQQKVGAFKALYEAKKAQYDEAKEIIARQAKIIANGE